MNFKLCQIFFQWSNFQCDCYRQQKKPYYSHKWPWFILVTVVQWLLSAIGLHIYLETVLYFRQQSLIDYSGTEISVLIDLVLPITTQWITSVPKSTDNSHIIFHSWWIVTKQHRILTTVIWDTLNLLCTNVTRQG